MASETEIHLCTLLEARNICAKGWQGCFLPEDSSVGQRWSAWSSHDLPLRMRVLIDYKDFDNAGFGRPPV